MDALTHVDRVVNVLPNQFIGVLGEHDGYPIERLSISSDRAYLASCSHDLNLKLWDLNLLQEDDEHEDEDDHEEQEEEKEIETAVTELDSTTEFDSDKESSASKRRKKTKRNANHQLADKKSGSFFDGLL